MYISAEYSSPLPLIGFSFKGAMSTSDLMSSFPGEGEAAGEWVGERERARVSVRQFG